MSEEPFGLPPVEWGFLFCEGDHGEHDGEHVTVATQDIRYWKLFRDAPEHARGGLGIPPGIFTKARAGWPDEWSVPADRDEWGDRK